MSTSSTDLRPNLLGDLRQLIDGACNRAAAAVNSELVTLYWYIGRRIRTDLLRDERAEYGKGIIASLGKKRNLYNMVRFVECFPEEEIVHALRAQLSWTHFRELIAIDDPGLTDQGSVSVRPVARWPSRCLQRAARSRDSRT